MLVVNEEEFERSMLIMISAGVGVAIVDFIVMAFVINKPNIVGFQNALISAGGVMVVVVVVLWAAHAILKRRLSPEAVPPPPPEDEPRADSAET